MSRRGIALRAFISRHRTVLTSASAVTLAAIGAGVYLLISGTAPPRPGPAPTPTPTPSSVARAAPLRSPFTGKRVKALHKVLVVKIDNLAPARPQTGLTKADIVYLEPVEGGLSRIFAVFSSHFPPVIGPVRSARQEDIQLLRQFGRPAFAYSGAQPHLLRVVERARIVDLYDGIVGGYYRDPSRLAPHNLYAHTRTLLAEARHASVARDIGFRFGPAPAGGTRTKAFSVSYPAAAFRFTWSGSKRRWMVWMDGTRAGSTEGPQLSAATVVIQYCKVRPSPFLELRIAPPYATTVGRGKAVVLRNGRAYRTTWSRPKANDGTAFRRPDGKRMTFQSGQVWVVLAYGANSTMPG